MSTITEQLKVTRKAMNLSQEALAQKLMVPQSHISAIETGKTDPRLKTLTEIALALDLRVMLVPRVLAPAVQAMISGTENEPLWKAREGDEF